MWECVLSAKPWERTSSQCNKLACFYTWICVWMPIKRGTNVFMWIVNNDRCDDWKKSPLTCLPAGNFRRWAKTTTPGRNAERANIFEHRLSGAMYRRMSILSYRHIRRLSIIFRLFAASRRRLVASSPQRFLSANDNLRSIHANGLYEICIQLQLIWIKRNPIIFSIWRDIRERWQRRLWTFPCMTRNFITRK